MNYTEEVIRCTEIFDKHLPIFWNSKNYRIDMLEVAMRNEGFRKDVIAFDKISDISDEVKSQTLSHDIGGLMRDDKFFIPRIS